LFRCGDNNRIDILVLQELAKVPEGFLIHHVWNIVPLQGGSEDSGFRIQAGLGRAILFH
jgi:hypothetical protein